MIREIANFREFRSKLKEYIDRAASGQAILVKSKRRNVVVLSLEEFLQLTGDETEYLLATESNKRHLQKGIAQVNEGDTRKISVDDLLD